MKKMYTLALSLIVAFSLFACASDNKPQEDEVAGAAPAFVLKDGQGTDVKLADFSGKVIILDFWATWCPPCLREIPHFVDLQKEYGKQGLQVIGISLDQQGWDVVKPFMQEQGINYPILMGDQSIYNAYQQLLPARERGGIPFTFILDRQGVIKGKFVGYRDRSVFEAAVKSLF